MDDKYKVLSIDFDYFVDADADTILKYFPDGKDLSPTVSELVWASRYQEYYKEQHDKILGIKTNHYLLEDLLDCLLNQAANTPFYICHSHRYLLHELLFKVAQKTDFNDVFKEPKIELYHIDFHHDIDNGQDDVIDFCTSADCGNWVSHLFDRKPNSTVEWFTRKASIKLYNGKYSKRASEIIDPASRYDFNIHVDDLSKIRDVQFDFVFLCRSDVWVPPHLDKDFDNLVTLLIDNLDANNSEIIANVARPRNMDRIQYNASVLDDRYRRLMAERKGDDA